MKKSEKNLLSILPVVLAAIFMILNTINFFPFAWRTWTNKLVFIILIIWLIKVLSSVKELDEE